MPWYPAATKRNIPPGSNDPRITPRLIVLHVAATMVDSLYDYFNGPSGGIESHFYVRTDGTCEQYRDTDWQADAQLDANDFALSIETQGLGDGKWTDAQLATIQRIICWAADQHPIPLAVCKAWDGSGVGYHTMWGAPSHWTPVAKTCPGPKRVQQFTDTIVPWLNAGAQPPEEDMQFSDVIPGTDPPQTVGAALRAALLSAPADALATFRANEVQRDAATQKQLEAILAAVNAIQTGGLGVDEVKALAVAAVAAKLDAPPSSKS